MTQQKFHLVPATHLENTQMEDEEREGRPELISGNLVRGLTAGLASGVALIALVEALLRFAR